MMRTPRYTWSIIVLLGLAQGAGLLHISLHDHAISPVTGKIYHVHQEGGCGHGSCPGPASPTDSEDECQVFEVLFLSAAPTAALQLPATEIPSPDLSPCRAPPLKPVARTFALWLLSPSLSPPGLSA